MKLIEALKRARVVPINAETLHVISSTETSLFETYLKAFSIERSWPRRTLASEFGQLPLALLIILMPCNRRNLSLSSWIGKICFQEAVSEVSRPFRLTNHRLIRTRISLQKSLLVGSSRNS